jgi:hypothetical protein
MFTRLVLMPVTCSMHMLYYCFYSNVMCIHYAFYLLASAVPVLFPRVGVPCCVMDI